MNRTVPRGVASWQSDESVSECFLCHNKFSLFFRRHHCRKCGRVVCGNCSDAKSTYLPTTYVVSPPTQIFLESPHVPHRTCDECMQELDMIRTALRTRDRRNGENGLNRRSRRLTAASNRIDDSGMSGSNVHTKTFDDGETLIQSVAVDLPGEEHSCPVCGLSLLSKKETEKESHISDCLTNASFDGSPDTHRRNRMIIYRLPEEESASLGECVICFEDLSPGNMVGRLECLCVYHERCILDWFSRRGVGNCPVHAVHV